VLLNRHYSVGVVHLHGKLRVYLFGNDRCESSPEGTSFVKRRVERRVVMLFDIGANEKKRKE